MRPSLFFPAQALPHGPTFRQNQVLQQLQQVQVLEMDQEVNQGQIDSVFRVELGDNLIEKMQVELLLRDGMVEEIRGMV